MLNIVLAQAGRQWGLAEAVARGAEVATFGRLARRCESLAASLAGLGLARRKVALALVQGPDWIAAAGALERLGCQTFLVPPPAEPPDPAEAAELAARFGVQAVLHDRPGRADNSESSPQLIRLPAGEMASVGPAASVASGGSVVLFTSGTSAEPKAVVHTWATLAGGIKRSEKLAGERMLLAYDLTRYAGVQMLLTALLNGARLSIPPSLEIAAIVRLIVDDRIGFASGTPTFWRMLLANSSDRQRERMALRQITLGGEPVTQPILDDLARTFPRARITHIYASTEMGVCFSVHDGREGFPASLLTDDPAAPARLKVEDGRLWARSARAMAGYLEGGGVAVVQGLDQWFNTGDAVEVRDDRVYFLGRASGRINVGGRKVYPERVEAVISRVAGVAAVRVSGQASSIVGQLVQAEVVPAAGVDRAELGSRIAARCREQLAAHERPRLVKYVDSLPHSDTMKVARRRTGEA